MNMVLNSWSDTDTDKDIAKSFEKKSSQLQNMTALQQSPKDNG